MCKKVWVSSIDIGKDAPKVLGKMGRILKVADDEAIAVIKKQAFNKHTIKAAVNVVKRGGLQMVRKLFSAGNNKRIRPLMLVSIIAFLEEEVQAGRLFPSSHHTYDRQHNLSELRKLYVKALPSFAGGSNGHAVKIANGASYHLMQLAFFHATALASAQAGATLGHVMGIEVPRDIFIFKKPNDLEFADESGLIKGKPLVFGREVDILLGQRQTGEIWVELKSYSGKANGKMTYPVKPWKWATGSRDGDGDNKTDGSAIHRQFTLDRIALNIGALTGKDERKAKDIKSNALDITVSDITWSFHHFKNRDRNKKVTTQSPELKYIKEGLTQKVYKPSRLYSGHVGHGSDATAGKYITMGQAALLMDIMGSSLKQAVLDDLTTSGFE